MDIKLVGQGKDMKLDGQKMGKPRVGMYAPLQ